MFQLMTRFVQMIIAAVALATAAKRFMDAIKDMDFVGADFRLGD